MYATKFYVHWFIISMYIWMCRGVYVHGKINIFIFLQNVCAHSFWNAFNFYLDDIAPANSLGNSQQYIDIYNTRVRQGECKFFDDFIIIHAHISACDFFFCWRVTTLSPRILKSNTIRFFSLHYLNIIYKLQK